MATTFELERIGEQSETGAAVDAAAVLSELAKAHRIEENRDRLREVVLIPSDHPVVRASDENDGGAMLTIDQALDILPGPVPGDLRDLVSIFDVAPAFEMRALVPFLAIVAVAEDSPAARRARAIRAHDVAVRRCLPAVLRIHGCREFSTELEHLAPLGERSLAAAERLLGVVQMQIDRRIADWFGRDAENNEEAAALVYVRDELVGRACRYAEALRTDTFQSIGAWEGPGFALAAVGLSVGWDEISCWEFLGPVLGLDERPQPMEGHVAI